jgi:hypothetical protein
VFTNLPGIENELFYFPSNLTSIGTYTTNDETGTLQISEQVNAVPEPSALLLLPLKLKRTTFKATRQTQAEMDVDQLTAGAALEGEPCSHLNLPSGFG